MIRDFIQFMAVWTNWHALFHGYVWLDWILLITCAIAVFIGLQHGFGFLFWQGISLLIMIFAVMLINPPLSAWAKVHLKFIPDGFWQPFFFAVIFSITFWLNRRISGLQRPKGFLHFHPFWDRVVGAVSGFFFALLVVSFISQFILLLPLQKAHKIYQKGGSRYGYVVREFVPRLVDGALMPVRALVNQKVAR